METIRSSDEIDRLFKTGKRYSQPLLTVLVSQTPSGRGPSGRVAFIAGKKIGGAVVRNRAKRLLREAVRLSGAAWPGYDVALIARSPVPLSSCQDVVDALSTVLRRSGLVG